jgi:hypothetical protein
MSFGKEQGALPAPPPHHAGNAHKHPTLSRLGLVHAGGLRQTKLTLGQRLGCALQQQALLRVHPRSLRV